MLCWTTPCDGKEQDQLLVSLHTCKCIIPVSIPQSPGSKTCHRYCLILTSSMPALGDVLPWHGDSSVLFWFYSLAWYVKYPVIVWGMIVDHSFSFHVFCLVQGKNSSPLHQKWVCVTLITVCLYFLYRSTRMFCTVKCWETGVRLFVFFYSYYFKAVSVGDSRTGFSSRLSCVYKYKIHSLVMNCWHPWQKWVNVSPLIDLNLYCF